MKTVRFASLVEMSGHPEVYLLLTDPKEDKEFQKALKNKRVLTVRRDKTDFGTAGYAPGPQSQVLVFPRPLKIAEGARVVGIHYDLLEGAATEKKSAQKEKPHRAKVAGKEKPWRPAKASGKKPTAGKVISFPKEEKENKDESEEVRELKAGMRKALAALEDGKQVAAFNLLQRLVD